MTSRTYEVASALVSEATSLGVSCATAESCTGGLVSAAITSVPGSSMVLRGAVVSYHPEVKHALLGVTREVIDDPAVGVVSEQCARQMCQGVARVLGADLAVSTTGIAGPGGGEPGKPVGTVWFGLSAGGRSRCVLRHFDGSRDEVRAAAVLVALELLREGIKELST